MKKFVICIAFMVLLVGLANAQTKSKTGTVTDYDAYWKTITVQVGDTSYVVFTVGSGSYQCTPKTCNYRAPKIVGNVKQVGQKVRVYYTRIDDEHGFGYILRATRIVAVK